MRSFKEYAGREQTYLKHFFLEHYLERVIYNVGSRWKEFTYVDGFSGPWKSDDIDYHDTSFFIASQKLSSAAEGLKDNGKEVTIKCLFIEKTRTAFESLKEYTESIDSLKATAINGRFENSISDIINFIGNSFSFVFIDPTGWTGFSLEKIQPILQLRGEVLINFMYDHINRFIGTTDFSEKSFEDLFGDKKWKARFETLLENYGDRENAILKLYIDRLKETGHYKYIAFTKILNPEKDRSYFYLINCGRNLKGLLEFRAVEQKLFEEQNLVRKSLKHSRQIEESKQSELFGPSETLTKPSLMEKERKDQLAWGKERLADLINIRNTLTHDQILSQVLEFPLIWKKDIDQWIFDWAAKNYISIENSTPREKTLKEKHTIKKIRNIND